MIKSFILETVSAPGTASTLNLGGPVTGRKAFYPSFASGSVAYYTMDDGAGSWEEGYGVVTSGTPNTLTRNVIANSAGNTSRINFTGSVDVYCQIPAAKIVYADNSGNVSVPASVILPNNSGYLGKDTGGTPRSMVLMDAANNVTLLGGTSGVLRVMDYTAATELARWNSTGQWLTDSAANWASGLVCSKARSASISWAVSAWAPNLAGVNGAVLSRVDNTSFPYVAFYFGASTNTGSITTNGTTTAYNTTSDYRLKAAFGPADASALLTLPVHDAEWLTRPGERQPMCMAHQVAHVAPWAVTGEKDATDATGNIVPQQVDYSKLVPALLALVQDQARRITALEARLP